MICEPQARSSDLILAIALVGAVRSTQQKHEEPADWSRWPLAPIVETNPVETFTFSTFWDWGASLKRLASLRVETG